MRPLFKKVAIVGTGLIGGSIALEIKKKKLAREVVGVSRRVKNLSLAKRMGAITNGSTRLDIIRGADLVILATPIGTMFELAKKISLLIGEDSIVSDVGSAKVEVTEKLGRIFPNFIGGHPLAGSEKRSISNARPDIFKGSLCVLTPAKNSNPAALKKMKKLWGALGAKVVFLQPKTHDRILSFVSHLPHAVAFSLISAIPDKFLKFGASGLKDSTRIAESDSNLWADIFLSNRDLLGAIKEFEQNLSRLKSAMRKKDKQLLIRLLDSARKKREILV